MFSNRWITKSTGSCSDNINRFREALDKADAVVIGAGAGLSTSAGFTYSGERFQRYFSDFADKFGIGVCTKSKTLLLDEYSKCHSA